HILADGPGGLSRTAGDQRTEVLKPQEAMPYLILSLVIQLSLVVHILKTGRNVTWVFIVLFFPLVGTLAYVFVELLPEWTGSRSGLTLRRKLAKLANPDRGLKQATQN